jgi:HK97 family phage major capsid protein
MHQTLLAVLPLLTIGDRPVYLPPQGLASDVNLGTLLGRPMYTIEYAETLGEAGDISLMDFSQYLFGQKARNAIARSVHVRFVEGEEAFRLVLRCDGIPMWNTALTPYKGNITTSPFVTLGERS